MQDFVTFETAIKLKEAGFPQPERLEFGQVFYPRIMASPDRVSYSDEPGISTKINSVDFFTQDVFAPRLTDIMPLIGDDHIVMYCDGWVIMKEVDSDFSNEYFDYALTVIPFSDSYENPAEAAAQMWLKLNQK